MSRPVKRINLYQAGFRPHRPVLPAATLLLGVLLFAAGLGAWHAWERWQLAAYRAQADQAVAQVARLEAQLAAAGLRHAQPADPAVLQAAADMEARLQALAGVRDALARGELGSAAGYAGHFRALAQAVAPGVWLTRVVVDGAGRALTLEGRSLQGDDPARLIEALARQPTLAGLSFATLALGAPPADTPEASPAAPALLAFTLAAQAAEPATARTPP